MPTRVYSMLSTFAYVLTMACSGGFHAQAQQVEPANPYERVDWATVSHYRADLHVHTLQSDGCHLPAEVITAYQQAGFSILSITDHDNGAPNRCPTSDAVPAPYYSTRTPTPYPDPRPANFPANTTWPWSDFGAPSSQQLEILGIEGSELTCSGQHMTSLFNDYGVLPPCRDAPAKNNQLQEVARRGGVAFINHPAQIFLEWYVEFYHYHSPEYLVGVELTDAALWDQLLNRLMPTRPVWGLGTSDMHLLANTQFAFSTLLLEELGTASVKEALRSGQFYSVTGPGSVDLRDSAGAFYDATYPELRSVFIDRENAQISIDAAGYDEIVWITKPASSTPSPDPDTTWQWPSGETIQRGAVFDYSQTDDASLYVRAELIRITEEGPIKLFLNPFGFIPIPLE